MMLGGVSSHTRREPPGKAERARAKAERAREEAVQAQAVRAEAEAKVAKEHEDEAHRQADLSEVAEKRPRPCRSGHQAPDSGTEGGAHLDAMGHDAENDLEHASDIARQMVGPMGSVPAIGLVPALPAAGSTLGPVAGLAPPSVGAE